eukprot:symbB.v1.2.040643.t2/scaffold7402.1/size18531/2
MASTYFSASALEVEVLPLACSKKRVKFEIRAESGESFAMTQKAMDIEEVIKTDHLFHPMRQLQRRTNLGLETAPIKSFISKTRFVSLGSYCSSDWANHLQSQVQETMQRRKERFLSAAAENLVFIRAVNDTEELLAIPRLFQALKRRFAGSHVRLLVNDTEELLAIPRLLQALKRRFSGSHVRLLVWEQFLNIPEYDPRHMRIRMEWASDEYCKSIAQAMKTWTSAASYSLWPSLASYKRWLCPFVPAYTTFQA